MFKSPRLRRKLTGLLTLFSMFLNLVQPFFLALTFATPAYAQDASASPSPSPSDSPSPAPSASATAAPTPTPSPSASPIESIAPSTSPSPSPSISPSASPAIVSPSPIASLDPSPVASISPTPSDSPVPTNTPAPADSSPAPPSGAVASAEASPSILPSSSPSPSATPAPENAKLSAAILPHTDSTSLSQFDFTVNEAGSATLTTNKADYAPTDTAIITGAGFKPHVSYALTVSSNDPPATSTTAQVQADAAGTIYYAYQLDGTYRPNYSVIVKLGSTVVATTTFTDGNTNLDQYANSPSNSWQNGNLNSSNSSYREGDSVPFREDITGLSSGTHTIHLNYDFSNGSARGYDFLTNYDRTVSPNPCAGWSSICGSWADATVPADSGVGSFQIMSQHVRVYNATSASLGTYTLSSGTKDIVLTFTTTNSEVILAWGGHLANPLNWGAGNGASGFPGSSLHMRTQSLDNGGGNNQDRSIQPNGIIELADIVVTKVVDSGTATPDEWCFNISPNPNNESLPKCPTTGNNTVSFLGLPTGSYQITETNTVSGYTFASGSGTNCLFSGSTATASVTAATTATNATCTFHNTQSTGTLVINKTTIGGDGTFDYTVSGPTPSTPSTTTSNGYGSTGNLTVSTGTYTVSETVPTGWTMTSDCTSSFVLAAGTTKTCNFTNTKLPTLTLKKHVVNSYGGSLTASSFNLHVLSNGLDVTSSPAAGSETGTVYTLPLGTYTVSEDTVPTGYAQTSIVCDNQSTNSITLAAGDNKTCTITNSDIQPKLTVTKVVVNDNGGTKTATDFPLFVGATQVTTGVQTGFNVGTYTISETQQSGYTMTGITGDCASNGSITLHVGDVKSCTINNNDIAPSLTLVKQMNIHYGGTAVATDWMLTATGPTTISGAGGATSDSAFKAGTYTLSESTGPTGYTASTWNCTGVANTGNSITLANGQSATCTITNSDTPGTLKVIKQFVGTTGDPTQFSFVVNSGAPITFDQSGENDLTVSAGAYSVLETNPGSAYSVSYNNCSSLTIGVGDSATCTITNTLLPTLTVNKVVLNNSVVTETGMFDLLIDAHQYATDVGNGGTTGAHIVSVGTHVASELAGTNTDLGNYIQNFSGDCDNLGQVTLAAGQNGTCTITNTRKTGKIFIDKLLAGPYGDAQPTDWLFTITNVAGQFTSGDSVVLPTGSYTISESAGDPDFTLTSVSGICSNMATPSATLSVDANGGTCTFTNTRDTGTLTVVKQVDNSYNGGKSASDFTLNVWSNGVEIKSDPGSVTGTVYTLPTGTYHVDENTLPTGYTFGGYTGCNSDGNISVTKDHNVTCTLENHDLPGTLIVKKIVINDNGGTKTAKDFSFSVDSAFAQNFNVNGENDLTEAAGYYAIAETPDSGYTTSYDNCTRIYVPNGGTATCTITNDDIAPTLTLTKVVNETHGGTAKPDDFQLTVGDTSVLSGATNVYLANHPYTLNETQLPGYTFTSITGDKVCPAVLGGTVTLNPGDNVSCTITNSDVAPSLTLVKEVNNQYGGTAVATDWTLTATGPTTISDDGGVVSGDTFSAGTYTLSESDGPTGYVAGNWNCTGVENDGSSINLKVGDSATCTLINSDTSGHLIVTKVTDPENTDTEFTIHATSINESGEVLSDATQTITGSDSVDYSVKAGTYSVTEDPTAGWTQTNNDCLNQEVAMGTTVHCTITNTELGRVIVTKYDDINGNGQQDEGESSLSDWTINLSSGETTTSQVTDKTGTTTFTDLLPGDGYTLSENLLTNWRQTNISCSSDDRFFDDEFRFNQLDNSNNHGLVVYPGSTTYCEIGNQQAPVLRISKSNNATGNKNPGDLVTYTLTVDLEDSSMTGVTVTDVPPAGFTYVAGSWTSTKAGVAEPSYGSPGTWSLGDMNPGDVVTLTYQAKISSPLDGGTYNDSAWGQGSSAGFGTILALGHDSPYVDPAGTFVGTSVTVNQDIAATGTANIEKTGTVLGAATSLPDTGVNTGWLLLALGSLIAGLSLLFGGKLMKKILLVVIVSLGLWHSVTLPVHAADPSNNLSVRIESPISPTRINNWKLGFSVLDRAARTPLVYCYVKKPGSSSFSSFGAVHTSDKPEGDNGTCQVDGSVMNDQGVYEFYVTAVSGADSKDSAHVQVNYDTNGPGTPGGYSKEHPSICRWVIHFHTAADNGVTQRVEIYSSDQTTFNTDSGTRVGTVMIGSDQDGSFTHDRASDCDRTWYYVIRAFDSVGNQSDYVGDSVVNVTTVTPSPSPVSPARLVTTTTGNVLGTETATASSSPEPELSPSPFPTTIPGTGLVMGAKDAIKNAVSNHRVWWIVGGVAVILGFIYVALRRRRP